MSCNSALNYFLSILLESLTPIKRQQLQFCSSLSVLQVCKTSAPKINPSKAQPWAILHPPSCHRASFPKGKLWSNKTWVWHLVGTFGHLAYIRVCWNAQLCLQCTDIHCTQPTQSTWACPGAVDLLCLCWTNYSWEWAEMTCPKSTALMVQVLTICVVYGSEIWPFPFIFDQWLCLTKRNFVPWHTLASQVRATETEQTLIWSTERETEQFTAGAQNKVSLMEDKEILSVFYQNWSRQPCERRYIEYLGSLISQNAQSSCSRSQWGGPNTYIWNWETGLHCLWSMS